LLTVTSSTLEARSKTDVIILENGDTVTGEIKGLKRGILSLKTDWMGTLAIEWKHVQEVRSKYFYEVDFSSGLKSYGSIQGGKQVAQMEIVSGSFTVEAEHNEVVGITPIEKTFLDRIKLNLELGANYYSANQSKKVTFGTNFGYRTDKYGASADFKTIFDQQDGAERTRRNELKTSFRRYYANHWSAIALSNFLQSEELNLDIRSVLGGGVSREVIRTNRTILEFMGGAGVNRENYAGKTARTSMEGLTGVGFQTFKFDKPEIDISTTFMAIPSFTEWGRYRLEFDASIRFKLVRDLYFRASLFENFDSQPPEGNLKNDFGIETTFGWEF
jgi:hypothetical protein